MAPIDPIFEFREDHRRVRDELLDMIEALEAKDIVRAREVLGNLNILVGPHFRYEEETLYPALRVFLGDYVDQLLKEHDQVVETARACAELLSKNSLTEEEANQAAAAARQLLIHVSNCDGLAILSERLKPQELEELGEMFMAAREAGVPLLEWAEKIRKR